MARNYNNSNCPLISVILPAYNVELYIKEAIDSVLNQTVQDFEIIVIDDCSTDATIEIVESIKDVRIRIIKKQQNNGLIDSLNIGFKESKGKYIARMDGDDISLPIRFEKQLEILQNNSDIKACGCWLQHFGKSNVIIKHKEWHKEIQSYLLISNPMSLGATMLEKDAYNKFEFFEEKIHVEDYDFWARTAWDCPMYNVQEVLYYYRVHDSQVSTKFKIIQLKGDIEIKLSLYKKLEYNEMIYKDELISKILYSDKSITSAELKLILKWFEELVNKNINKPVYDNSELKKVLFQIRRKLIYEIFFTNNREGLSYDIRKKMFVLLPFMEMRFVLKKKIKEKLKLQSKRF